jgi:fucose 4-O-acetylase-like acetyltransferase
MTDMCVWKIRLPWQIEIAGMMVFYMALGYLYRKHEETLNKCSNKLVYFVLLTLIYCIVVFAFPNMVDIHRETFQNPFLFVFSSVIVILPIVYISKKIVASSLAELFKFWGQNTLFYYAFGGIVRIVLYMFFEIEKIGNDYIVSLLCTVLTMLPLMIPAAVVRKYFSWAVGG